MKVLLILPMVALLFSGLLGWAAPQQEGGEASRVEAGYLDLATARRSAWPLFREIGTWTLSGTATDAFRMTLVPEEAVSVRPGESLEIVVRLENISSESIVIPWETNWESILGPGPEKLSEKERFPENFPDDWTWMRLRARAVSPSAEKPVTFPFDGKLYGCKNRPETVLRLEPGTSVRIRALAQVPPKVSPGVGSLQLDLWLSYGFDLLRYKQKISAEPVPMEILAPSPGSGLP